MPLEYRPITPDEFAAFQSASSRSFGEYARPEMIELEKKIFQFDRSLAAVDDGRFVGSGVLFSFRLTVPGGLEIGAGGVSYIGVRADYRRQGILTEIMTRQFRDVLDHGEALAILYASESLIYGRFGFGVASMAARFSIETQHRQFGRQMSGMGRVRLVEKDEAERTFPAVYERVRQMQPGAIAMPPSWWDHVFSDPEVWWQGAGPRFYAVYENPTGQIEGYVGYRVVSKWEDGFPAGTLRVTTIQTVTPEARLSLWQYVLNMDLMTTVETGDLPIDEPLREVLIDPRRLRTTRFTDSLWVRLVDIPTSLSARRYRIAGDVVIDVIDPFLPENSGRYLLTGGPDGAECARTERDADLALDISDLGAAYLGGTRLCTLAAAGRVRERTPGALDLADVMFSSARTPYTSVQF